MSEQSNNRIKWLHLRLTIDEQEQLQRQFNKTTERKISSYARKILLGKPMIAATRDQSLQDILAVLLKMRADLNGIGNNFNQAVHKLHTLDHIPEFKRWTSAFEKDRQKLLDEVTDIRFFISKTSEKWLR